MPNQWKAGIFGCLEDPRLCCFTFLVPCYTLGKNAESLGEDCMLIGLLACLGLNFGPVTRWRLRQERGIEGSMLMDVLLWTVLPCCALVQEAREIAWELPKEVQNVGKGTEAGPPGAEANQSMSRS